MSFPDCPVRCIPESPSTQDFRTLVLKSHEGYGFWEPGSFNTGYLDPLNISRLEGYRKSRPHPTRWRAAMEAWANRLCVRIAASIAMNGSGRGRDVRMHTWTSKAEEWQRLTYDMRSKGHYCKYGTRAEVVSLRSQSRHDGGVHSVREGLLKDAYGVSPNDRGLVDGIRRNLCKDITCCTLVQLVHVVPLCCASAADLAVMTTHHGLDYFGARFPKNSPAPCYLKSRRISATLSVAVCLARQAHARQVPQTASSPC